MQRILLIICFCLVQLGVQAQFAPQAGVAGTTAVDKASGSFTGWATGCTISRGYVDIADPSQGKVSLGTDADAVGMVDNFIVSLGDSGVATLTFSHPIYNGPGADFAVFENGFANPTNPEEAFLELAFVEVSSDGINFHRFAPSSLSSETVQVPAAGVYMNARLVNNLAGKYIANYGTPFDLQELEGISGLDLNNITHVRIVDVIGSLSGHETHDKDGHKINDPYPTAFSGGGFDLDGVGAFYQHGLFPMSINEIAASPVKIYPNPTADKIFVQAEFNNGYTMLLTDLTGKTLQRITTVNNYIDVSAYKPGIYALVVEDANGKKWVERITKL
jgi:hypothetical protein